MRNCPTCDRACSDTSRYCEECGTKLSEPAPASSISMEASPVTSGPISFRGGVTSVGIPPLVIGDEIAQQAIAVKPPRGGHARLTIERGEHANTEFNLAGEESYIGRWDADNGIFPDVDLDAHDPDAKVSRRHARIIFRNDVYMIEDLGSTNGTFVNRGRRLLPGTPQVLSESDEIIVGKTFLRFHINS